MPFSNTPTLLLACLLKVELPAHTIRLCDGAFVVFAGEGYASADPVFGTLGGVKVPEERLGDDAVSATMTLLPPTGSAAAALCSPAFQNSRVRFWMVEVDQATGLAIDAGAELLADLRIDISRLRFGRGIRAVEVEMMGSDERAFLIQRGNVLSARFHRSVWPGEAGFDNMTGVAGQTAFGVLGPPRGTVVVGGGGGGGGGNSPEPGFRPPQEW